MIMKKILIVDDAQNIRITLKRCLSSEENELDVAMNGEEAFAKIMENDYDLVFLDLQLPAMSGIEVLRKLRYEGNHVNVVIITAYGTVENAVEAMKLGAIDFVQKPFSPGEIRRVVSAVWARNSISESQLKSFEDFLEFSKQKILEGDYEKAEGSLHKALTLNPGDAEANYYQGLLFESKGETEKAKETYRKVLKLQPSYSQAEENLNHLLSGGSEIRRDEEE